jgi:hypothetical protein
MDPTSIGRAAMWAVDAPGILDVHAFVYYDGRALFVQSADTSNPARGNGQAIGGTWQQVEIPCTIELGRARIVYRTLEESDDDDKTVARPIEEMVPAPGGGGAGGVQFRPGAGLLAHRQDEEERTRFAPMDFPSQPAAQGRQPEPTVVSPLESPGGGGGPRPAAGAPAPQWSDAPGEGATNIGAPVPAVPSGAFQQWGGASGQAMGMQPGMMQPGMPAGMMQPGMMQPGMMQPGMMQPGMMQPGMMQPGTPAGMMQPGMMQPGMMQPGVQPGMMQPGVETGKVATAAPQSFVEKVKQDWAQTSFIKKGMLFATPLVALMAMQAFQEPEPPPEEPGPVATATSTGSHGPSTSSSGRAGGGPSAPAVAPTSEPLGVLFPMAPLPPDAGAPKTPKKPGPPTPEREAADAVAMGNYAKAAQIYDQLAVMHPERAEVYKTAARVARAKAGTP